MNTVLEIQDSFLDPSVIFNYIEASLKEEERKDGKISSQ